MNLAELIAHQLEQLRIDSVGELARLSQGCAVSVSKPTLSKMARPMKSPWMPEPGTLLGLALVIQVHPLVVWTALAVTHKQAPPSATVVALRELPAWDQPTMVAEGEVSGQDSAQSLVAALALVEASGGRGGQRAKQMRARSKRRPVPAPRAAGEEPAVAPAV